MYCGEIQLYPSTASPDQPLAKLPIQTLCPSCPTVSPSYENVALSEYSATVAPDDVK